MTKPLPALDDPLYSTLFGVSCLPPSKIPQNSREQTFMEKLYAFVTIKQLLKDEKPSARNRALNLALENNFVTEQTSLVVIDNQDSLVASSKENVNIQDRMPMRRTYSSRSRCRGSIVPFSLNHSGPRRESPDRKYSGKRYMQRLPGPYSGHSEVYSLLAQDSSNFMP